MPDREFFDYYLDPVGTRLLCETILSGAGLPADQAAIVVDNLIQADLRGVSSHGISRMAVYSGRLASGGLNTDGHIETICDAPAAMRFDARNNMGAVAGTRAMEKVIERARQCGIAACTVFNGNHYGFAAYYSLMAVRSNMIGLALSNAPATMAPWGGRTPMMGTNPFCIAVPAARHRPMVLDCATSVVARGKINLAAIEGRDIPEGLAMDPDGRPTTDANAALAGSVLPFGMYKGSGLSMMIDVLSAVLSGASFGMHVGQLYSDASTPQNLGHFFAAIDIGQLNDLDVFKANIDTMIDDIKGSEKAPGTEEIYVPGEIEFNNEAYYLEKGIGVGPGVLRDLAELSLAFGDKTDPKTLIRS